MTKCPVCGYQENLSTVLQHNVMSVYVDDKTGVVDGVYNSVENYITIKDKKLRRQDYKAPVTTPVVTAAAAKKV